MIRISRGKKTWNLQESFEDSVSHNYKIVRWVTTQRKHGKQPPTHWVALIAPTKHTKPY